MSKSSLILSGSYSGQQSVGDMFLLSSVVAQMRKVVGKDVEFLAYVHQGEEESRKVCKEVQFKRGMSSLLWRWFNKLRHLKLPFGPQLALSALTLPLYVIASPQSRAEINRLWREIRAAGLFYFFGGTQLSKPWFWINWPPLVMTLLFCRIAGVSVYFGPQQYGPQTRLQRALLRLTINSLVKEVRTRNEKCLELLGRGGPAMYDEVFSCSVAYPIVRSRKNGRFLLLNVRGDNFASDGSGVEFEVIAELLAGFVEKLGMPIKVFEMSGSRFCDDQAFRRYVKGFQHSFPHLELQSWEDKTDRLQWVADAYGTLSMSFHGCLLSIMGGCPSVPMVSGSYYEYKYADFDKYTGYQGTPIIHLGSVDVRCTVQQTLEYFERYDPVKAAQARADAVKQMSEWYESVAEPFTMHE